MFFGKQPNYISQKKGGGEKQERERGREGGEGRGWQMKSGASKVTPASPLYISGRG